MDEAGGYYCLFVVDYATLCCSAQSDQTVVHTDAEEVMAGDAETEEALSQFDFLVSERGKYHALH